MSKPSRSKYQLIFEPMFLVEQLAVRHREHKDKYGKNPRKIFLTEKQYNLYRDIVRVHILIQELDENTLYFRGAKIYKLKNEAG